MSATLLSLMSDTLTADDWSFEDISDDNITALRMQFQGTSATWVCLMRTHEDAQQLIIYSVAPMNAPEDRRAAVAEAIARINYGLRIGNFELDYNDGEVRYKTSVDVEGGELTSTMAMTLLTLNLSTMDQYLGGLFDIFNGADPEGTVLAIEEGN